MYALKVYFITKKDVRRKRTSFVYFYVIFDKILYLNGISTPLRR